MSIVLNLLQGACVTVKIKQAKLYYQKASPGFLPADIYPAGITISQALSLLILTHEARAIVILAPQRTLQKLDRLSDQGHAQKVADPYSSPQ